MSEPVASAPNWRGLRFFNAYRLIVAALLLAAHALPDKSSFLQLDKDDTFTLLSAIYGVAALALLAFDELRRGRYATRLQVGLALDLLMLGLLGHVEGAPAANLQILMIISMAYASLLLGGRESLAFAALGSIHLLVLAQWDVEHGGPADMLFTHAGLLGMALFAVAILARDLARRLAQTERIAAQRGIDLANETQLNQLILARTHEGVIVIDENNDTHHANEAALRLLHCQHHGNRQLGDINPELAEAVRAWRLHPEDSLAVVRIARPERLHVRITPLTDNPQGPAALFIEDDAYLMDQLQRDKLAAIGRLTASIAHELRNPLGAIGQAGQLLEQTIEDAQDRRLLGIIRSHVGRINRIVENVLLTSRRKLAEPQAIELSDWLGHFIEQYRELHASEDAVIELAPSPTLLVQVDPGHLEQVLLILLDNARLHGAPRVGPAHIRIDARPLGPQKRPCIEICDDGPGIPPELRERLFEPFFTTHPQGTGLGLFIARELAEANQLSVQYHPGMRGESCFRLTFPRHEPPQEHREALA